MSWSTHEHKRRDENLEHKKLRERDLDNGRFCYETKYEQLDGHFVINSGNLFLNNKAYFASVSKQVETKPQGTTLHVRGKVLSKDWLKLYQ